MFAERRERRWGRWRIPRRVPDLSRTWRPRFPDGRGRASRGRERECCRRLEKCVCCVVGGSAVVVIVVVIVVRMVMIMGG